MKQSIKLQLTRSDWENAGPYTEATTCPIATALKRTLPEGNTFLSFSHKSFTYTNKAGVRRQGTLQYPFYKIDWNIARTKYDIGEEVLFETEINI